jgi:hypothetical protein
MCDCFENTSLVEMRFRDKRKNMLRKIRAIAMQNRKYFSFSFDISTTKESVTL